MNRLLECVPQQPFRVLGIADPQCQGGQAAQCANMAGVCLQYFAEQVLGSLAIPRDQRCGCLLDSRALRIEQPRLLERELCVCVLLQFHQQIAIGKPRTAKRWCLPHYPPQQFARRFELSSLVVGACQVNAGGRKLRLGGHCLFERLDGGLDLPLRQ